ncbi:MAG: hypothetical protein PHD25_12530, partial [Bacteroidales bacterium]|nr:hypothetical protein [Bacteroidales bacterium]
RIFPPCCGSEEPNKSHFSFYKVVSLTFTSRLNYCHFKMILPTLFTKIFLTCIASYDGRFSTDPAFIMKILLAFMALRVSS